METAGANFQFMKGGHKDPRCRRERPASLAGSFAAPRRLLLGRFQVWHFGVLQPLTWAFGNRKTSCLCPLWPVLLALLAAKDYIRGPKCSLPLNKCIQTVTPQQHKGLNPDFGAMGWVIITKYHQHPGQLFCCDANHMYNNMCSV